MSSFDLDEKSFSASISQVISNIWSISSAFQILLIVLVASIKMMTPVEATICPAFSYSGNMALNILDIVFWLAFGLYQQIYKVSNFGGTLVGTLFNSILGEAVCAIVTPFVRTRVY
eukprot:TRINITY_DN22974_c0_g1_i1.p1 TRINITY_DN22974_c0_g1~~TRINITY_DN22974_c0_g1_i1.p1  ORF type:complete len:123 (-),score=22.70 TRINITY_DN22974_c0_g1_i1:63-410(-)